MGYSLRFSGEVPVELLDGGSERHIRGVGAPELDSPDWNMTYNYSSAFAKAFKSVAYAGGEDGRSSWCEATSTKEGLWRLSGKTPAQQIADLETAIASLSDEGEDDNYWHGSAGNARKILRQMRSISSWWLRHHPELANQTEEGVWSRGL